MYSQHDEEKHILEWFKYDDGAKAIPHGRYLDIGAWTGLELSNTRRLAELGWSGVAVEPAAGPFRKLMENYRHLPLIELVCAALCSGDTHSIADFRQSDDAISAFATSEHHLAKWGKVTGFQKTFVIAIPHAEFFAKFPPPFDFVNIDTEGANWDIVEGFPFQLIGASLVCVEVDDKREEMKAVVRGHGFTEVVYESAENLIVGKS